MPHQQLAAVTYDLFDNTAKRFYSLTRVISEDVLLPRFNIVICTVLLYDDYIFNLL